MFTDDIKVGQTFANYRELCKALRIPYLSGNSRIKQLEEIEREFVLQKDGHKITILEILREGSSLPFTRGAVFPNYKELCKTLDEEVRTGHSKATQLKHWESYFSWERKGISYVITEIRDVNFIPARFRVTTGRKKEYIILMEQILLNMLYHYNRKEGSNTFKVMTVTNSYLREVLGMVNEKYKEYYTKNGKLSKEIGVEVSHVKDFYSRNSGMFNRDIENVLKNLRKKRLINFSKKRYVVPVTPNEMKTQFTQFTDEDGDTKASYSIDEVITPSSNSRIATPQEDAMITEIEFKTMRAMGFSNIQGVHAQGFYPTYINYVNKNLIDELGFYRAYYAYELTFSQRVINWIAKNSEITFILDSDDLAKLKSETNTQVQETIMNNAKKRNENYELKQPIIGFGNKNSEFSYDFPEEKPVIHDKKYVKDYEVMNKSLIESMF
mgnify:CR=1 FL=1